MYYSECKDIKIRTYKTIILPVVLYGCETWSLTLREERRLRVFENRVLSRIFGPLLPFATYVMSAGRKNTPLQVLVCKYDFRIRHVITSGVIRVGILINILMCPPFLV
jgi:hypothetical protein